MLLSLVLNLVVTAGADGGKGEGGCLHCFLVCIGNEPLELVQSWLVELGPVRWKFVTWFMCSTCWLFDEAVALHWAVILEVNASLVAVAVCWVHLLLLFLPYAKCCVTFVFLSWICHWLCHLKPVCMLQLHS